MSGWIESVACRQQEGPVCIRALTSSWDESPPRSVSNPRPSGLLLAGQHDDGRDEARSAYEYAMMLMSSVLQMAITKQ